MELYGFQNEELESLYRTYQFELNRNIMYGRWGTLSICSLSVLCMEFLVYIQEFSAYWKYSSPDSLLRMMAISPVVFICLHHQFSSKYTVSQQGLQLFTSRLLLVIYLSDCFIMHVNDAFPERQGCPKHRFRCPYTFSSAKFASIAVAISSAAIFHLTPCFSIWGVVKLSMVCGIGRILGLFTYSADSVSCWSLCCAFLQVCIFLWCRYVQEQRDRRKFLMQLHIFRLRSNLQELLDSMMPPSIALRVKAGETIVDEHPHAIVFFCSFPTTSSPQVEVMKGFLLLDRVHKLFDQMHRDSDTRAFKVEFVGNDFMLISPVFFAPHDGPVGMQPDADRALCVVLGRLAAQMSEKAREILAGSGLDLRFGIAAGPLCTAVIGATRRHVRVIGEAATSAGAQHGLGGGGTEGGGRAAQVRRGEAAGRCESGNCLPGGTGHGNIASASASSPPAAVENGRAKPQEPYGPVSRRGCW